MDGYSTIQLRNITKIFNRLSRVHERYRQTTDDKPICDGIPERNAVTFGSGNKTCR